MGEARVLVFAHRAWWRPRLSAPPFLERSPQYDSRSDAGVGVAVFYLLFVWDIPDCGRYVDASIRPAFEI